MYHAPAPGRPGAPVVLHCHGVGVEQLTLCRQEVLAARAAAAAGFPVLRWSGRGQGDSGGETAAVTLGSLVEDARTAADVALRRSGAHQIVWLGVRVGALVAARAAAGRADTAGLGFWEPVHRLPDFVRAQLRGLLFSQVAGGRKPDATVDQLLARLEAEGGVDVFGYVLHRAFVESGRDLSLADALSKAAAPVLIAQVQPRPKLSPPNAQLADALQARGVAVATACVPEEPGYQLMSNPAWTNAALTLTTVEWLDGLA